MYVEQQPCGKEGHPECSKARMECWCRRRLASCVRLELTVLASRSWKVLSIQVRKRYRESVRASWVMAPPSVYSNGPVVLPPPGEPPAGAVQGKAQGTR